MSPDSAPGYHSSEDGATAKAMLATHLPLEREAVAMYWMQGSCQQITNYACDLSRRICENLAEGLRAWKQEHGSIKGISRGHEADFDTEGCCPSTRRKLEIALKAAILMTTQDCLDTELPYALPCAVRKKQCVESYNRALLRRDPDLLALLECSLSPAGLRSFEPFHYAPDEDGGKVPAGGCLCLGP